MYGNGVGLWLCVWHRVLGMSMAEGYAYGGRLWHRAMAVPYGYGYGVGLWCMIMARAMFRTIA